MTDKSLPKDQMDKRPETPSGVKCAFPLASRNDDPKQEKTRIKGKMQNANKNT